MGDRRAGPEANPEERLQTLLGWGLRVGILLVVAGMATALIWALASGDIPPLRSGPLWPRPRFDPTALVLATALVLVLLPPARVVLAAVAFARERNGWYVAFSLVALLLIGASSALGIWLGKG